MPIPSCPKYVILLDALQHATTEFEPTVQKYTITGHAEDLVEAQAKKEFVKKAYEAWREEITKIIPEMFRGKSYPIYNIEYEITNAIFEISRGEGVYTQFKHTRGAQYFLSEIEVRLSTYGSESEIKDMNTEKFNTILHYLPFFRHVKKVSIFHPSCTYCPTFPDSVEEMEIGGEISTIQALPPYLKKLKCSTRSNIKNPPRLPNSLTKLKINHEWNTENITTLPQNLISLDMSYSHIPRLTGFPTTLKDLFCYSCTIPYTAFQSLPPGMESIHMKSMTSHYATKPEIENNKKIAEILQQYKKDNPNCRVEYSDY